jgi:hypothetical protein
MAKTYYKYKPREVETLINWGEIGKTITDQLSAQATARQQTRDDVRQQEADFAQKISEAPQGVTEDSNAKIIKFGNDLSDAMLLNTRMLRSGAINLRDYQLKTNNLKTGTKSFFDIANKFNEMYTQRLTDAEEGKTLDADLWLGELTQNLGGSGSQLYIDPNNFVVGITQTETGEDGVTKSKGKPMPLNVLLPAQNQRFMKKNITGNINEEVEKLGAITRVDGRITLDDARQGESYDDWKNSIVNKFTSTPEYLLNVLSQFNYDMVKDEEGNLVPSLKPINYDYVLDEEEAGGDKIYMKERENVPGFEFSATEDQQKRAKEIVGYLIESQVESKMTKRAARSTGSSDKKGKASDETFIEGIEQLYTGVDDDDVLAGAEKLSQVNANITRVEREDDNIVFYFKDGSERPISIKGKGNTIIPLEEFIKKMTGPKGIYQFNDINKALKQAGDLGATYSHYDKDGKPRIDIDENPYTVFTPESSRIKEQFPKYMKSLKPTNLSDRVSKSMNKDGYDDFVEKLGGSIPERFVVNAVDEDVDSAQNRSGIRNKFRIKVDGFGKDNNVVRYYDFTKSGVDKLIADITKSTEAKERKAFYDKGGFSLDGGKKQLPGK